MSASPNARITVTVYVDDFRRTRESATSALILDRACCEMERVASGAPFSLTECADANMRARKRTRECLVMRKQRHYRSGYQVAGQTGQLNDCASVIRKFQKHLP